jgi:two-component system OmpR family sensor kinase
MYPDRLSQGLPVDQKLTPPRMGRLFWKFFLVLLLAQVVSVLGLGLLISWHNREYANDIHREQRFENALPHAGESSPEYSPLFASPPLAEQSLEPHPRFHNRPSHRPSGRRLILFPPLMSGLAASLIFASLLAWYFAKPIRSLSRAFEAASQGDLAVRLGAEMGGRRDELADLGRDFDSMAQRLQGLMDGQRRLFHDVSHELRSPLARLQVAIGLARQQPERIEQALARVERESVRMDQLVSELLTLARLESGLSENMNEEISLGELVGNIIEDSRVEAEAKQCVLRFDEGAGADELLVAGNPELLRRGVENVLRNAIKHSPQGSEVVCALSERNGDKGSRVEISIRDQGSGVPDSALQHIFEPFFRGADARIAEGHGLGLAIAQRVVAMHDGSITAHNLATGGFIVLITLPQKGFVRR